jgi:hypothetical protein
MPQSKASAHYPKKNRTKVMKHNGNFYYKKRREGEKGGQRGIN